LTIFDKDAEHDIRNEEVRGDKSRQNRDISSKIGIIESKLSQENVTIYKERLNASESRETFFFFPERTNFNFIDAFKRNTNFKTEHFVGDEGFVRVEHPREILDPIDPNGTRLNVEEEPTE
jgi:putative heme degradation protein